MPTLQEKPSMIRVLDAVERIRNDFDGTLINYLIQFLLTTDFLPFLLSTRDVTVVFNCDEQPYIDQEGVGFKTLREKSAEDIDGLIRLIVLAIQEKRENVLYELLYHVIDNLDDFLPPGKTVGSLEIGAASY